MRSKDGQTVVAGFKFRMIQGYGVTSRYDTGLEGWGLLGLGGGVCSDCHS